MAGERTGFMVDRAKQGHGHLVRRDAAPLGTQAAAMHPIKIGSVAYAAWRAYWRRRGADVPIPDRCRVIFMRSAWPPHADVEPRAAAGL